MIRSMTGFASATLEFSLYSLGVDLRSVNHRFLDIQFRMPEELRSFESELRELVVTQAQRGKLECRINLNSTERVTPTAQLVPERLKELKQLEENVREQFLDCPGLRAIDILKWPNVLVTESLPLDEVRTNCLNLFQRVLGEFNSTRMREGEKLKSFLLERVTRIEETLATIGPRLPQLISAYQAKLVARLQEAAASLDEDRIRQEVALFAAKIDIDEELSRLKAHLDEVRRVLETGGVVGKRLDFLIQELNREANTINSKSVDISVSRVVVDIKVLLEQLREQIQNIE